MTEKMPKDPVMLLSYVNTQLRDFYGTLQEFCAAADVDEAGLREKLAGIDYRERVEMIAKEVYGADGVDWAPLALEKAKRFESDPKYADYCTMMVKTHLSLSHEPSWKGVPKGWRLPIRDILEYGGAKFLCPMAGTISMMPGTSSDPAYRRVDVDTETGKVSGLF